MKKKITATAVIMTLAAALVLPLVALQMGNNTQEVAAANTTFNITTEVSLDSNYTKVNVDKTLPAITATDFTWYVNNVAYQTSVAAQDAGLTTLCINWKAVDGTTGFGKCDEVTPVGEYYQYRIKAGTVLFSGYELGTDWNIWYSQQSSNMKYHGWAFTNGGADANWGSAAMPSCNLTGSISGGAIATDSDRGGASYYQVNLPYTSANASFACTWSWNGCPIWEAVEDGSYALYSSTDSFYAGCGVSVLSGASGNLAYRLYFPGLGITVGETNTIRSFYMPTQTLLAGINSGYSFWLEDEVYFDCVNGTFYGIYNTPISERVYTPIASLVSALHMSETTDGQCTSYWSAAKTAYNALSDEAKTVFSIQSDYADAYARYNAWAAANAGGSGVSALNGIVEANNQNLLIAVSCLALSGLAIGLFFLLRHKRKAER